MKYWCPECKTEIIEFNELSILLRDANCPICNTEEALEIIPDFETPEQYEKRTGKKWNGAVWVMDMDKLLGWDIRDGRKQKVLDSFEFILCANSPEPPPDDYIPQEVDNIPELSPSEDYGMAQAAMDNRDEREDDY